MKEFEFKDQMYDLHKLILLNKDNSVKEYSEGIVKNIKTNMTDEELLQELNDLE